MSAKDGKGASSVEALTRAKQDLFSLYWGRELMCDVNNLVVVEKGEKEGFDAYATKAKKIVAEAVRWNNERRRMVILNFCLFTLAVVSVVGIVIATGGVPVIGSAIVMCVVSLTLNILNTRRVYLYFQSKEIGKWDERILMAGMIFTVAAMTAAILMAGGGVPAIILLSLTGALILTLKGCALYKLHQLRKKREGEVTDALKK